MFDLFGSFKQCFNFKLFSHSHYVTVMQVFVRCEWEEEEGSAAGASSATAEKQ